MDFSQLTGSTSATNDAQVQGSRGRHHHHKSIADQASSMETAIDNAVKAGKLTDDQATAMKKELDDVKQTIGQNGSIANLSDDDKKKVLSEMKDVRKQLHSALNPQASGSASQDDRLNNMFSAMDSNGDGSVSKDEFAGFMSSIADNYGYNDQGGKTQNSSAITGAFSTQA